MILNFSKIKIFVKFIVKQKKRKIHENMEQQIAEIGIKEGKTIKKLTN